MYLHHFSSDDKARDAIIMNDTLTRILIGNIILTFSELERDIIAVRLQECKVKAKHNPDFKFGIPRNSLNVQIIHASELLNEYSYENVEQITKISKSALI